MFHDFPWFSMVIALAIVRNCFYRCCRCYYAYCIVREKLHACHIANTSHITVILYTTVLPMYYHDSTMRLTSQRFPPYRGFLKWGYPQSSSILLGFSMVFHYKPSSYWGTPMTMEITIWRTPYYERCISACWQDCVLIHHGEEVRSELETPNFCKIRQAPATNLW